MTTNDLKPQLRPRAHNDIRIQHAGLGGRPRQRRGVEEDPKSPSLRDRRPLRRHRGQLHLWRRSVHGHAERELIPKRILPHLPHSPPTHSSSSFQNTQFLFFPVFPSEKWCETTMFFSTTARTQRTNTELLIHLAMYEQGAPHGLDRLRRHHREFVPDVRRDGEVGYVAAHGGEGAEGFCVSELLVFGVSWVEGEGRGGVGWGGCGRVWLWEGVAVGGCGKRRGEEVEIQSSRAVEYTGVIEKLGYHSRRTSRVNFIRRG